MLPWSQFVCYPLSSREAEFAPDVDRTGRYVLFKFLGPMKEDAERVGVHCIKLYGHKTSSEEIQRRVLLSQLVGSGL